MEKKPSAPPPIDSILDTLVCTTQLKLPAPPPKHLALNKIISNHQHIWTYHTFLSPKLNNIYDENGKKLSIKQLMNGTDKEKWLRALSNKYGHLAQRNDYGVKGTDTIKFILLQDLPNNKQTTYASFVCDYCPLKKEWWRILCVIGDSKLPYQDDAASPVASLLNTKLMLNSTI